MTGLRLLRLIVPSVIGGIATLFLLKLADLPSFRSLFASMRPSFFWGALIPGVACHLVNGCRIRNCLDRTLPRHLAASISSVHMLLLNVMPFRSGELSFLFLARKFSATTTLDSVYGLGIQRFWDMITLLLLSIITCCIAACCLKDLFTLSAVVAGTSLAIILAGLAALLAGPAAIMTASRRSKHPFVKLPLRHVARIMLSIRKKSHKSHTTETAFLSLAYWGLVLLQTYWLLLSLVQIDLHEYIVLFTIISLWALLPIHGFMAIGTTECALVFIMTHLGFDTPVAVAAAIGFRALAFLSTTIFGSIGAIILWASSSKIPNRHQKLSSFK